MCHQAVRRRRLVHFDRRPPVFDRRREEAGTTMVRQ
ncbi:unnamed protein product [Heligmosomoides polygyrus]|uniref:Uncharacterized protein n=1 Tax=Heligmosomoides polygyrus TaxID=6339 RepID=A0A3P8F610_HELPZ|nr:unnamed protein product [Heligmosomoides polygyrus]